MKDWICEHVRSEGPITFAQYMEWALYHPRWGYYTTGPNIGPQGDFTTSPEASPAFGRLLAKHVAEVYNLLADPPVLHTVEFGPGMGTLAADLLDTLRARYPSVYARTLYWLVEVSPALAEAQRARLLPKHEGHVRWVESMQALPSLMDTVVLANEFVDAFPVHVVENYGGQLVEQYVGVNEHAELCLVRGPVSHHKLLEFLDQHDISLQPRQKIEINLAAEEWIRQLGEKMTKGVVTIIDYGDTAPARYSEVRKEGTLLGYHGGRVTDNPLANPGQQDLTALVDFTALQQAAHRVGFATLGLLRQAHFLVGLGLGTIETVESVDTGDLARALEYRRGLHALVSMEGLGRFHVLVLGKNVDHQVARAKLSGLRYAHLMDPEGSQQQ